MTDMIIMYIFLISTWYFYGVSSLIWLLIWNHLFNKDLFYEINKLIDHIKEKKILLVKKRKNI